MAHICPSAACKLGQQIIDKLTVKKMNILRYGYRLGAMRSSYTVLNQPLEQRLDVVHATWSAVLKVSMSIPVYQIANAKHDKLPKHSEVVQDQEIKPNGFAYIRDVPEEQKNYTWYAVKEDDHVVLLGIEDLIVQKDGTKLYLPVRRGAQACSRTPSVCMHTRICHAGVFGQANPQL